MTITVVPYKGNYPAKAMIQVPEDKTFSVRNVIFDTTGDPNETDGSAVNRGTVLDITGGSVTLSNVTLKNATQQQIKMSSGSLKTTSTTVIGKNSNNASCINMTGGTLSFGASSNSTTYYNNINATGGEITVTAGRVNTLNASSVSKVYVSGGTVYNMTVSSFDTQNFDPRILVSGGSVNTMNVDAPAATITISGGNVSNLYSDSANAKIKVTGSSSATTRLYVRKQADVEISGGSYIYTYIQPGAANSTVKVTGGRVSMLDLDAQCTAVVSGGTVSTADVGTANAKLYAYGGTITETDLSAQNSFVYSNGKANLTYVDLIGSGAHIMLGGEPSNKTQLKFTGNANYYSGYPTVWPWENLSGAAEGHGLSSGIDDATVHLAEYELYTGYKERFVLGSGSGSTQDKIILTMNGVYIDTQNGNDANSGTTPDQAVKSFKQAGIVMDNIMNGEGRDDAIPAIYVIGTAEVVNGDTLHIKTNYKNVFVMPYSTSCETLVQIGSGVTFEASNVDFDGKGNNGACSTTTVVHVNGGTFNLEDGDIKNASGSDATNLKIENSGNVTLGAGADITNNNSTPSKNVDISDDSSSLTFSGTISGAQTGIFMAGGTVNMTGTVSSVSSNSYNGVTMTGGTFNANSGTIRSNSSSSSSGVGVAVSGGTFNLNGATVYDNYYAGVKVSGTGEFVMTGGSINSNDREGVILEGGTFTMQSGSINGNNTDRVSNAAGVEVSGTGEFTMKDGSISNNQYEGVTVSGGHL